MNILAILRGRPGLGHVTPAIAILEYFEQHIEQCNILVASYDNGIKFLEKMHFNFVDIGMAPEYECWAGFKVIDDILLKIQPIIEDFKPEVILSSGEYLLPIIKEHYQSKFIHIYNPEIFVAKKHNRPYRNVFNDLFSKCDILLGNGYMPTKEEAWEDALPLLERTIEIPLVRKTSFNEKPSNTFTILVGNGGGVSLPSNTQTYSDESDLVSLWKRQNYEYVFQIIKEISQLKDKRINIHSFLCLTQEEQDQIKSFFIDHKNIHFYEFSPEYIKILNIADLVITRAGVNSILEVEKYGKHAIIWPLSNHAEQIRTTQEVSSRNPKVDGLYELDEFSAKFNKKLTYFDSEAYQLECNIETENKDVIKRIINKIINP